MSDRRDGFDGRNRPHRVDDRWRHAADHERDDWLCVHGLRIGNIRQPRFDRHYRFDGFGVGRHRHHNRMLTSRTTLSP
jgi:hypothetical protein